MEFHRLKKFPNQFNYCALLSDRPSIIIWVCFVITEYLFKSSQAVCSVIKVVCDGGNSGCIQVIIFISVNF